MAFKIGDVLKGMADAAAGVLGADWPGLKACVTAAFEDEREALEEIAQTRIKGDINDAEMKSQLDDEKETLKAALLACEVKGKAAAQNAVNAALKVLTDAISAAL